MTHLALILRHPLHNTIKLPLCACQMAFHEREIRNISERGTVCLEEAKRILFKHLTWNSERVCAIISWRSTKIQQNFKYSLQSGTSNRSEIIEKIILKKKNKTIFLAGQKPAKRKKWNTPFLIQRKTQWSLKFDNSNNKKCNLETIEYRNR